MSDMKFGGTSDAGLKWMAIESCFSLRQDNVDSMSSKGIRPFNNHLHFMLGAHTITFDNVLCGGLWAKLMISSNVPVWEAWQLAGINSFQGFATNLPIEFAVWGHRQLE